jgi:ribosome-associated toxin RatA of RatAB toxin-antitoxin module
MAEHTEASIVIDAPPAQVMAVIADLGAYPEWSDGITAVKVLSVYDDDQRPADVRFSIESGPIKDTYELEYDWNGDERVTWTLTKGDMVTMMDGAYDLTPSGESATNVKYRLAVDVRIPMIGMLKRKAERVIVDTALKGLKKRVESSPPC